MIVVSVSGEEARCLATIILEPPTGKPQEGVHSFSSLTNQSVFVDGIRGQYQ